MGVTVDQSTITIGTSVITSSPNQLSFNAHSIKMIPKSLPSDTEVLDLNMFNDFIVLHLNPTLTFSNIQAGNEGKILFSVECSPIWTNTEIKWKEGISLQNINIYSTIHYYCFSSNVIILSI
tara:strand:- start:1927 stop:2292 length:366 start_codon:yes stop_codon:yes gene_type:complete